MKKSSSFLLVLFCAFWLAGCTNSSNAVPADGLVISGEVFWKGVPLKWGNILLIDPNNKSNTASADITDGKFTIAAERRLKPGTYLVMITGGSRAEDNPELSGPPVTNAPNPFMLPVQYGEKSTTKVEIKAADNPPLKYDLK